MNDSLTGLPNRRKFFSAGDHEIIRAHRLKSKLWVLMLDIDHFKKINDTAGHETGDNVLKEISQILKSSLREVDLIGRLGGEEFGVILTDIPQKGAARVAETIRSNIEKASIEGWTDIYGALTISIGCASVDNKSTLEQILKKADEALYYSKNKGRNQTTFFDDIECRS
jgi:diguanylate cyclase (GGDEF)-like protein